MLGDAGSYIVLPSHWRTSMTATKPRSPGYVVLRQVGEGRWELAGEAERRLGLTARRARAQAVADATGDEARPGEVYGAVLRSEWRISFEL
jgi:hypothetical protein